MKAKPDPPRLASLPEFADLLEPARERRLGADRLARTGVAIRQRITAGQQTAPRWRLAPVAVACGLLLCVGAGAYGWHVLRAPEPVPEPAVVAPANSQGRIGPVPDGALDPLPAPVLPEPRPRLPGPDGGRVAGLMPAPEPEEPQVLDRPLASDLPRQIELYQRARSAARGGDFQTALGLLGALERGFPASPLLPEVRLSRADWLVRAGRHGEAARVLDRLLNDPGMAGKRAQLWHLMGDVRLHQGRCPEAAQAFRRALGLGLTGTAAQAARRGLSRCPVE